MEAPDLDVRLAARALARHGLVHAYGHVSARVDRERFVVTPPHPLGRVLPDTALVTCPVEGALPEGALPEVRMHQEIYRRRADVGGVCRFQSPRVIALSATRRTPQALHGLGAYFAPSPALWDDPALVRDQERATAVVAALGDGRAVVLRGNGAVTIGSSVREAACHAFFLEDAAAVELAVLASGESGIAYTSEQAAQRTGDKRLYERMWEYLLGSDLGPQEARS
jgi:HCOMODA/2-hydroxy-3-carboxy-muconic semialdehyde decarboxylase